MCTHVSLRFECFLLIKWWILNTEWHDRFTDSLVNFETVKHFTAERYEKARFSESVSKYQSGSVNLQASLSFLNVSMDVNRLFWIVVVTFRAKAVGDFVAVLMHCQPKRVR